MGCNCFNKTNEEENEINNEQDDIKSESEPEIENLFNPEEYENVMLTEKKEIEEEEEIANLEPVLIDNNENVQNTNNKFNITTLELINQVRKDPKSYSKKILDNIQYITQENKKIIFKRKVKVLLNLGEIAFQEASKALANMEPMEELIMKPEINIPLPVNENEMSNNNFIKNKADKIRENHNINIYFKNMIKNPEIAVLLLIVDDSVNSPGKKRNAILNPEFRKIGIISGFIGKTFISHFSFSK